MYIWKKSFLFSTLIIISNIFNIVDKKFLLNDVPKNIYQTKILNNTKSKDNYYNSTNNTSFDNYKKTNNIVHNNEALYLGISLTIIFIIALIVTMISAFYLKFCYLYKCKGENCGEHTKIFNCKYENPRAERLIGKNKYLKNSHTFQLKINDVENISPIEWKEMSYLTSTNSLKQTSDLQEVAIQSNNDIQKTHDVKTSKDIDFETIDTSSKQITDYTNCIKWKIVMWVKYGGCDVCKTYNGNESTRLISRYFTETEIVDILLNGLETPINIFEDPNQETLFQYKDGHTYWDPEIRDIKYLSFSCSDPQSKISFLKDIKSKCFPRNQQMLQPLEQHMTFIPNFKQTMHGEISRDYFHNTREYEFSTRHMNSFTGIKRRASFDIDYDLSNASKKPMIVHKHFNRKWKLGFKDLTSVFQSSQSSSPNALYKSLQKNGWNTRESSLQIEFESARSFPWSLQTIMPWQRQQFNIVGLNHIEIQPSIVSNAKFTSFSISDILSTRTFDSEDVMSEKLIEPSTSKSSHENNPCFQPRNVTLSKKTRNSLCLQSEWKNIIYRIFQSDKFDFGTKLHLIKNCVGYFLKYFEIKVWEVILHLDNCYSIVFYGDLNDLNSDILRYSYLKKDKELFKMHTGKVLLQISMLPIDSEHLYLARLQFSYNQIFFN